MTKILKIKNTKIVVFKITLYSFSSMVKDFFQTLHESGFYGAKTPDETIVCFRLGCILDIYFPCWIWKREDEEYEFYTY